jgi:hypothetical protein
MRPIIFTCIVAALSFGCKKNSSEQTRYFDDGRMKPSVVLVPLIDSSGQTWEWNLSEELTNSLKEKLIRHGKLYIADDAKAKQLYQQLNRQNNPFSNHIEWIKQNCPKEDFAVFLELIEHEEVPLLARNNDDPARCPSQFNISLRIRVIDLRSTPSKIVLQEILHDQHHIPRQFTKFHFHQEPWGKQGFPISPVGLAHAQLIREISSRVEDYILTSPTGR